MTHRPRQVSVQGFDSERDDEGKSRLGGHTERPAEFRLAVNPRMKALERSQRLMRVEAMCELERVGQHPAKNPHHDREHRRRRGKQPDRQHEPQPAELAGDVGATLFERVEQLEGALTQAEIKAVIEQVLADARQAAQGAKK